MKKQFFIALAFAPTLLGYLMNGLAPIMTNDVVFILFCYAFALASLLLWFWIGRQFSRVGFTRPTTFLLSNSINVVCFLILLWQLWLIAPEARNASLMNFSFSFGLPLTQISNFVLDVCGGLFGGFGELYVPIWALLALLVWGFVFAWGYPYEKKSGAPPKKAA